jgi:hypothetical protein
MMHSHSRATILYIVAHRIYRLTKSTKALIKQGESYIIDTLPERSPIAFDSDRVPQEGHRLVEVVWKEHIILIAPSDLRNAAVSD